MEPEIIESIQSLVGYIPYFLIISVFFLIHKYVDMLVSYFKDIKIAKMMGRKADEPEHIITYLLKPETEEEKKTPFDKIKAWLSKRKEKKEFERNYGFKPNQLQKL